MAPVLEHKRRVRLRDADDPPEPRPRRSRALGVGLAAWLVAVAVAWGVSAGSIPVERWLDAASDGGRSPPRRAPGAAARGAPPRHEIVAPRAQ